MSYLGTLIVKYYILMSKCCIVIMIDFSFCNFIYILNQALADIKALEPKFNRKMEGRDNVRNWEN